MVNSLGKQNGLYFKTNSTAQASCKDEYNFSASNVLNAEMEAAGARTSPISAGSVVTETPAKVRDWPRKGPARPMATVPKS